MHPDGRSDEVTVLALGHLDEGDAHAFVDGALPAPVAARVIAHVAGCERCAGALAEARGLAAASTRILGALDAVPRGVVPAAPVVSSAEARPAGARAADARLVERHPAAVRPAGSGALLASRGWPVRAAAALLLAAGLGSAAWQARRGVTTARMGDAVAATATPSAGVMASDVPAAMPPVTGAAGATAAAAPAAGTSAGQSPAAAQLDARRAADREAARAEAGTEAQTARAASGMAVPERGVVGHGVAGARVAPPAAPAAPPTRELPAPLGIVAGEVRDDQGRALASAAVVVDGTAIGTTTDSAGRFTLRHVPPGTVALRTRRTGYATSTDTVVVAAPADTARPTIALRGTGPALSEVAASGAEAGSPRGGGARRTRAAATASTAGTGRDTAVAGCYAVGGPSGQQAAHVLPALARLTPRETPGRAPADGPARSGAVLGAGDAEWGTWTLGAGDTLVVRWRGAGTATLVRAGASGEWRGTRVVAGRAWPLALVPRTGDGGCPAP